jgi:phenylalanine-4-hydroxylase
MTKYVAKAPDENGVIPFTEVEHQTWKTLIQRQKQTIQNRACDEFIQGLEIMDFSEERIPSLNEVTAKIARTGWKVAPVLGTVLVDEFFAMLSRREFPVATFIRIPEELDYLQQPDIFHEFFGHCPLLTNQAYADFVQWYGEFASQLSSSKLRGILSRLFWFTIEFGLLKTENGPRVYGGGILSSHKETIFSLEDPMPVRKPLNIEEVLATKYFYDRIQDKYFVIDSLDSLYDLMDKDKLVKAIEAVTGEVGKSFIIC